MRLWRVYFLLLFFLPSCTPLSEEELNARRYYAFDLSGSWKVTSNKGNFFFKIKNQDGKKYDILLELDLAELIREEKVRVSLKAPYVFTPEEIDSYYNKLLMGQAAESDPPPYYRLIGKILPSKFEDHGGENISRDFGRTSEFGTLINLCASLEKTQTESLRRHKGRELKNRKWSIVHCLSGTARQNRGNIVIDGKLQMSIIADATYADDSTDDNVETDFHDEVIVNYTARRDVK